MPKQNVSRLMQSYLQLLTEQANHYAVLRLFNGLEMAAHGRLCLDAQVPALLAAEVNECACSLVGLASYCKNGNYCQELLSFEAHYDPAEVLALGPARWGQLADTLAYQLIGQLVQWCSDKDKTSFSYIAATTGLKPDRQRFYL